MRSAGTAPCHRPPDRPPQIGMNEGQNHQQDRREQPGNDRRRTCSLRRTEGTQQPAQPNDRTEGNKQQSPEPNHPFQGMQPPLAGPDDNLTCHTNHSLGGSHTVMILDDSDAAAN